MTVETVRFSLYGDYEIDLGSQNAAKLRAVFGPYIAKSRRLSPSAAARKTASGKGKAAAAGRSREDDAVIRQFGRDHGYDVKDRGRIPARVIREFEAANG